MKKNIKRKVPRGYHSHIRHEIRLAQAKYECTAKMPRLLVGMGEQRIPLTTLPRIESLSKGK